VDPVSVAAVSLGAAVAKSACKLWCGDNVVAADAADTVADLLKDHFVSALDQRAVARKFGVFADKVAEKVLELNARRFEGLPDNEREAAILAVRETFAAAPLTDATLYRLDLDALYLERHLRSATADRARRWGLSEQAVEFYNLVLRESCTYVLEISATLPRFVPGALAELLRRLTVVEDAVVRVLDRIPGRDRMDGDDGFAADYRRQVVKQLDRMELFGAAVSEANRGYPLSVAYISLNLSAHYGPSGRVSTWSVLPLKDLENSLGFGAQLPLTRMRAGFASRTEGIPVLSMLANTQRLFVRGEAGCGKTTLLHWIAVTAAHQSFPSELASWNETIPFFIPLRRYAQSAQFPAPEQFLNAVGRLISAEMPDGWVRGLLESGRALLLIDGVDELPVDRRNDARTWLRELTETYPNARYVVTCRPAAVSADWLVRQNFTPCVIQPMTPSDIRQFIGHWHEAMRSMTPDRIGLDELDGLEHELQQLVVKRRDLRQLATNPLLCALLCALNRDRRTLLPRGRIELYRVALEMFLQRRDSERHVAADSVSLTFDDKYELLQDVAYWLMRNSLSDAPREAMQKRLAERLRTRRLIKADPVEVLTTLLERSGLLREPEAGRIDFIHRTFQEYLAAQAALANDDIGMLVDHAADDQWHQTIVLAVGLGSPKQRDQLLTSLLDPPRKLRNSQHVLDIVALASMETAGDMSDSHTREITKRARRLLPPSQPEQVTQLAAAGELALELIDPVRITTQAQARNTARLAAMIGGSTGLGVLEHLTTEPSLLTVGTLIELWEYFDPDEYAERILAGRVVRTLELASSTMTHALSVLPDLVQLECRFNEPWEDYSFLDGLPALRAVRIVVPFSSSRLVVGMPPRLGTITVMSQTIAARALSTGQSGANAFATPPPPTEIALEVIGLDTARVLAQLELARPVQRLRIVGDPRLYDLRELLLPTTIEHLTIEGCAKLCSMAGLESSDTPTLQSISLDLRPETKLDISALWNPRGPGSNGTMLDQLQRIDIAHGDIGDLVYRLANTDFTLEASGYKATWKKEDAPR
jgi:hypothetical protein